MAWAHRSLPCSPVAMANTTLYNHEPEDAISIASLQGGELTHRTYVADSSMNQRGWLESSFLNLKTAGRHALPGAAASILSPLPVPTEAHAAVNAEVPHHQGHGLGTAMSLRLPARSPS